VNAVPNVVGGRGDDSNSIGISNRGRGRGRVRGRRDGQGRGEHAGAVKSMVNGALENNVVAVVGGRGDDGNSIGRGGRERGR